MFASWVNFALAVHMPRPINASSLVRDHLDPLTVMQYAHISLGEGIASSTAFFLDPREGVLIYDRALDDGLLMHGAGAFYLRLVGRPLEVYQYLEPLYNDYRRVRLRTEEGHFTLTHVDELVDEMLRNEYLFDIALPRVPNRYKAIIAVPRSYPTVTGTTAVDSVGVNYRAPNL